MLKTKKNSQLSIEKKIDVKFVETFSGLFSSISSGTMVKMLFLMIPPEIYSK